MSQINRIYTFATNPSISSDIGSKIDQELNQIVNTINSLDDANIDGSPAIQSSKLSLGGAGYLPLAGGSLTGVLNHAIDGIWRAMGTNGTGLVKEYRYGNTVWGIAYNTSLDANGSWTGRDISDICLRMEFTKTSDGWGGLRVYLADSLGAGATPVWNPVQHYEPMGGHSRYRSSGAWSSFVGDTTATTETNKSGIFNFNSLTIPAGVTWTLSQGQPLIIFARESVTINGTIDGDGKGALGGALVTGITLDGIAGSDSIAGGSGGGGGGANDVSSNGGNGGTSRYIAYANGGIGGTWSINGSNGNVSPYPELHGILANTTAIALGGAGGGSGATTGTASGAGGNGGGYIYIVAPIIKIGATGIIRCKGSNGLTSVSDGSGGGGGGGVIHIVGKSFIADTGYTIDVSGGYGSTSGYDSGSGGTGLIYIEEYR